MTTISKTSSKPGPSKTSGTKPLPNGTIANGSMVSKRPHQANGTPNGGSPLANGHLNREPLPKSSVLVYNVTCALEQNRFTPRFSAAAWDLLVADVKFLINNVRKLPTLLEPMPPVGVDLGQQDVLGQLAMLLVSLALTVALGISVVIGTPIIAIALTVLFVQVSTRWQGATGEVIRESNSGAQIPVATGTEAWFCVNGIGITGDGAERAANRLEQLFHRRITVIVNRSLGIWFDLIECILQRNFDLNTLDIRRGYKHIREAVRNPKKRRVVIIGHSQGGIAVSAWVDQLLCDFPEEILSKVEIYTFASAADHFSRPTSKDLDFPFLRTTNTPPFGCVEHFANEDDLIAQFGVLGHVPRPSDEVLKDRAVPVLKGDFGGRIFVRRRRSGHLLLSHYLHPDDCILHDPEVRRHSNLVNYLAGLNIAR